MQFKELIRDDHSEDLMAYFASAGGVTYSELLRDHDISQDVHVRMQHALNTEIAY